MTTTEVTIPTRDGDCPAVLVTPDASGPWPGVVLCMDAGGVRPAMVEIADGIAAMGYAVLVPELYHREGVYQPFDFATVWTDEEERTRLFGMLGRLTKDQTTADLASCFDYLDRHEAVAGSSYRLTGYCLGGGVALTAAGRLPDRVAAVASFHGGNLASDKPDSPHLVVGSISAPVLVVAAENDNSFPAEQEARLAAAFRDGGVDATIETYPALHGFAVSDAPVFDTVAAERHYAAIGQLFASASG